MIWFVILMPLLYAVMYFMIAFLSEAAVVRIVTEASQVVFILVAFHLLVEPSWFLRGYFSIIRHVSTYRQAYVFHFTSIYVLFLAESGISRLAARQVAPVSECRWHRSSLALDSTSMTQAIFAPVRQICIERQYILGRWALPRMTKSKYGRSGQKSAVPMAAAFRAGLVDRASYHFVGDGATANLSIHARLARWTGPSFCCAEATPSYRHAAFIK